MKKAPLQTDVLCAFYLEAKPGHDDATLDLWARGPEGELAMKASAGFKA